MPTALQARYLYHIAAIAPNKYARATRVLLLRSAVFVVVCSADLLLVAPGRFIAPASIEATPGPKSLALGRANGPSQVLWKIDRYGSMLAQPIVFRLLPLVTTTPFAWTIVNFTDSL